MTQKKGELRLMVDGLKDMLRGDGKDMAQYLGDIREPVEKGRALQAWREMSPAERAMVLEKMGLKKGLEWYKEMGRREAQSDAAKTRGS